MKVLMVGATGKYAGMVLPELVKRGHEVRALVRDSGKADAVQGKGATEVVAGDLTDPASLRAAAKGTDGVFHINPAFAPHEADLGVAMIDAAVAAGVGKLVFSGVMHPTISSMVNHTAKATVEEALYASRLDYTILQPAMFTQMLAGVVSQARDSGRISAPYSKNSKMSYVDYRDVAEVAATAMDDKRLSRGTFELSSPGMFDRGDLADLIGEALGRSVEATEVALADAVGGMPAGSMRDGMTRMLEHYDRHGFPGGNALVLEAILGRPSRTVAAYLQELTAA